MAIKRMQMYRRNLDGTETNLNPLTESQYVLMENGQTVQEILSDRDSDKYTPVITNSSSTFKVGQGDNVDLSSSMKEGAYDSCVLKGKTMVNCIQEPSSKDVVLPYEFADGQYVTINDTKESGALGVELKGQTLVNIHDKKTPSLAASENDWYSNLVIETNSISFTVAKLPENWRYINFRSLNLSMLKPNTKYLVAFEEASGVSTVTFKNGDSTHPLSDTAQIVSNKAIVTTTSDWVNSAQILYIYVPADNVGAEVKVKNPMIIEYVEGMENWDIPYFTGMTSVKLPILSTVGKNLFDGGIKNGSNLHINTGIEESGTRTIPLNFTKVKPNTTYTFSRPLALGAIGLRFYDKDKNYIKHGSTSATTSITFTTPNQCYYIKWVDEANKTTEGYQIEEGSTGTTYEPHKTSILSLPEEVVLRSLPNGVCDTFNTRTGVYTQRIGDDTFIGASNENWRIPNNYTTGGTMPFRIAKPTMQGNGSAVPLDIICDKMKIETPRNAWGNDGYDGEGLSHGTGKGDGVDVRILKSKLPTEDVAGFKQWLSQNPIRVQYQLHTPIITKINLSSTLKSWNTTTHIYSEIPENTLYPTLVHSNPTYPVILKPSTKYSIVANSYSNNHTNSPISFNLGGTTASTVVGNRVTTITTPSTLSNELLTMSGRGNKLNNVMVIEGDVVGDEPYFEGICDCKSPILSNVGENLFTTNNMRTGNIAGNSSVIEGDDIGGNWQVTDYIPVKPLIEYYHSTSLYKFEKASFYDINKKIIYGTGVNNFKTRVISTPHQCAYVRYVVMKDSSTNNSLSLEELVSNNDIVVAQGSSNIAYEPYKSNILSFNQKDDKTIVLRSLPNGVCDTLNVENGEYVQRIGEVVLDGSKTMSVAYADASDRTTLLANMAIANMKIVGENNINDLNVDKMTSEPHSIWSKSVEGVHNKNQNIYVNILKSRLVSNDWSGVQQWLSQNPITVQYELATPIVTSIDVQGFPYAYTNGHVQLSSGSIEQSLTPTVEYSLSANKTGQINSNTKRVSAHQKQLDDFEAMMLTSMVQSAYDKAILQFDYEMQMMSLGGE